MVEKKINFTIMSDQKKHKTMDLSSISPVIIDVEEQKAFVDMGALHARSQVEKGIKFGNDPNEVPDGKRYTLVWISTGSNERGEYIHGAGACDMIIDANSRKGFKNLADHVNKMDAALKGRFRLEDMGATEKEILKQFIISFKQELWENSPEEFKQALS